MLCGGVEAVVLSRMPAARSSCFGVLLAGLGQVDLLALLVDPVIALAFFVLLAGELRDDRLTLM